MSVSTNTVDVYSNKFASKSVEKLYLNTNTTDVNFIFESDDDAAQSISAHKILLATASDVFHAMFFGELKENGDVKISGVTAAAFKEFLQFIYLNEVHLTIENIADVMGLGHKYNVTDCFDTCVQFLKDKLSDDNACLGYGLAILYEQDELKELCENEIAMNTEAVFKSKYFLEADRQILAGILNMELLSCSEIDVFEACMAWVKSASKQNDLTKDIVEAQLDGLFYNIRFASMTIKELCILYRSYGNVLTPDEFTDLTQMIVMSDYKSTMFTNDLREKSLHRNRFHNDYYDDYDDVIITVEDNET